MIFEAIHNIELPWIQTLHQYRTPFFDTLFTSMNFFDRSEFYFLLIPLVWYLYSPKFGVKLLLLCLVSSLINSLFKTIFHQPRPLHLDPTVGLIPFASFGFPSGAAQTAVIIPYLLIKEIQKPYAWILGILFFFLLSFSRIYIGAHYPSDLVGGWIIGLILAYSFYRFSPTIETSLKILPVDSSLIISSSLLLLILFLNPTEQTFSTTFSALGAIVGLFFANKYLTAWPQATTLPGRLLQALLTILAIFALNLVGILGLANHYPAHQLAFKSLTTFLISLTAVFLCPLLYSPKKLTT